MSSYFDEKTRQISMLVPKAGESDSSFLEGLRAIEALVIRDVSLVTGDKHCPEDLREKIQTKIAVWEARPGSKGEEYALMGYSSVLICDLHSLFHELASRRVQTPFGLLNDSPTGILERRDAWLKGE